MPRFLAGLTLGAALAVAATLAAAPASTQYRFTGTVAEVDPKARLVRVDKNGDVWEFSTEGLKDLRLRKGERVAVLYQMIARKIESSK